MEICGRRTWWAVGRKVVPVIVVGEGQTEEAFVKSVLTPLLGATGVFLYPWHMGGALTWSGISSRLRDALLDWSDAYVTTFFDLYGLRRDFPGLTEAQGVRDPLRRAAALERSLHQAVVNSVGCRPERFIPHIQPYEFEALLFSDVDAFGEEQPEWQPHLRSLWEARRQAASPEHINDGAETHPSALLVATLRPRYEKVIHGPSVVARIGIDRLRQECAHFGAWLSRIEALTPLSGGG